MIKKPTKHNLGLESYKSKSGVFVIDANREITFWSESAEKILGFSQEEVINSKCYVTLCKFYESNNVCSENCHPVANSIRNRVSNEFEVIWADKKGKKGKYRVNTLFSNSGKKNTEIVHVFTDITNEAPISDYVNANELEIEIPVYVEKLTKREGQALKLLSTGMNIKDMSKVMTISQKTAGNHIFNVMNKLGAKTQLQAVIKAAQLKVL